MNNLLRGLIAGIGAKKLGGGCFGSILVFIIIWVALGQCDNTYGKQRSFDHKSNGKEIQMPVKHTSTPQPKIFLLRK